MKVSIKTISLLLITSLSIISICHGTGNKIMFSQYTETNTGSTPKGYEIWNFSDTDINLSTEPITIFYSANENTTLGNSVVINTGIFKAGDVIVVGRTELETYLSEVGLCGVRYINKQYTFNGNDYLQLELNGVIQDVIGVNGSSTVWTNNGVSTANQNIQLKSGITTGYTTPPLSYDPSAHFTTLGVGSNLSGFGIPPVVSSATSLPRVSNVNVTSKTLIHITFSEPMMQSNPTGNITGVGAIASYSWETSTLLSITLSTAITYGLAYEISITNFEDLNTGAMCSAFLYPFVLNPITKGLVISEVSVSMRSRKYGYSSIRGFKIIGYMFKVLVYILIDYLFLNESNDN